MTRSQKGGFTLVITLTLMILLTILAVGMLTLSSVALRSARTSSAQAIARSNARLALMLALGELQRHTGPDQRVTAPADIAGGVGGVRLSSGSAPANTRSVNQIPNGLSTVLPGTRYWTACWQTSTASNPPAKIYTKPPEATDIKWLISGNEEAPNTFTPASSEASVGSDGTVSDPSKAVVLVGSNSVGAPNAETIDSYVAAPLVEIETTSNGASNRGRYAWWIGDEGTKARINGVSPISPNQPATAESLAGNRGGWEVVGGMETHPVPGSANHSDLEKVVTLPSYELLTGNHSLDTTKAVVFHGASTVNRGVLADSLQGGLRIDLNSSLSTGFPPSTTFPNTPKAGSNILPSSVARGLKGPKWDSLKAFYTESKSASAAKTLTVKAAGTSGYDITIAPIITDLRLLFGVRLTDMGSNSFGIVPCGKIAVSLANPYPYPLEWTQDLELEIIDETPYTNSTDSMIYGAGSEQRFMGRNAGEPAVFNKAVFVISKDSLEPGEARAYTISRRLVRPYRDTSTQRIAMKPMGVSSPSNFEICVELSMNPNEKFTDNRVLDDRESWTTTQPTAELRLAGRSGNILRRVERMEFDNGFHLTTKNYVNASTIQNRKMPFPLLLYSFEISQPGARYDQQLPAANLMGTRNSTLRTFTDFNLRASKFGKLITSYAPPPYFFIVSDNENDLPVTPTSSSLPSQTGPAFTKDLALDPLPWGRASNSTVKKTVLFSFPQNFASLAQLQHADLTADDQAISVSQQPGNAVGNSYATPFVKRDSSIQRRMNYIITGQNSTNQNVTSTTEAVNYYDMSYLLNAALWDTFYFSPFSDYASTGQSTSRMLVAYPPSNAGDLQDPLKSASCLLIDGAFNVNCTSKEAWMALLGSTRFQAHPSGDPNTTDAMFPRSLEQPNPSNSPPSGVSDDSFSGYRRLTSQEIEQVAEELVKQVRLRGPFVSLSHFVNRTLVDANPRRVKDSDMLGRSGPLQTALDLAGVNISPDGKKNAFGARISTRTDQLSLQADSMGPKGDLLGASNNQPNNGYRGCFYGGEEQDGSKVWAPESKDLNPGACASIYADRKLLTDRTLTSEQGYRSTGIPGWVTQADVLQAIGPSLSARSDTFRIRTYGEALSPDGKTVLAKAYCEAIVQRTPFYLDQSNAPTDRNASPTDNTLGPINKTFGRRYQIVSMRWLSNHEI